MYNLTEVTLYYIVLTKYYIVKQKCNMMDVPQISVVIFEEMPLFQRNGQITEKPFA